MDFVTVREFRTQPGKVWKKLKARQDLVVTRNGKPFALITYTEPDRVEENLRVLRRARFQEALSAQHLRARRLGLHTMSMAEIDAEIAATRGTTRTRRARRA